VRPTSVNIERTNRNLWIGLGVIALLVLVALPIFGGVMWGGMMGRGPFFPYGARPFVGAAPWLWGIGLFGLLIRLAVWGVLIVLVVSLFRRFSAPSTVETGGPDAPSSLEILRRRYAAGEITREQFEEMRHVLEPSPASQ
jgi:putative membrane protein